MSCAPQTVAACVFQGHRCEECPLIKVLMRRVHALGIEEVPAYVDRELDKYRAVARVLDCPRLARIGLRDLSPQRSRPLPAWPDTGLVTSLP